MSSTKTFLYFGYGSNLLAQRIHVRNPSAVRKTAAKLVDYRFDFNRFSKRWGGCAATIVPDVGRHVWGAVWEIDSSHMADLDDQEGVNDQIYKPLTVKVTNRQNETLECRVYQLNEVPQAYDSPESLPRDRRPSRIYLETILQGAVESGLPDDYFKFLQSFPHNGYKGPIDVQGLNISLSLTKDNSA